MSVQTYQMESFIPIVVTDFMDIQRPKAFSLILPAYNEATRQESSVDPITGKKIVTHGHAFEEALDGYKNFFNIEFGSEWDLTVVNDGSKDNTSDIAIKHEVNLLEYTDKINRGRGFALKIGFMTVNGSTRSYTDADGSYSPESIMRQFEAVANNGYDIAVAHRAKTRGQHESLIRAVAHDVLHWTCELPFMAHTGVADSQAGAQTFSSKIARSTWPKVSIDGWAANQQVLVLANLFVENVKIADNPANVTAHDGSTVKPISDAIKMLRDARSIGKMTRRIVS